MIKIEDCLNKRVLAIDDISQKVIEIKILEIAPSKKYVKVKYISDIILWENIDKYKIIEILN